MPIVVHIGNVRQGKSYAAVADRIVPALAEGRHVVTNIEGMASDEAREKMRLLLAKRFKYDGEIRLTHAGHSQLQAAPVFPVNQHREDEHGVRVFDDSESLVKFGSLIVWDEASKFETKNLPDIWREAITYHGHWARDGRCVDMVLVHQHWDSLAPIIRASSELVFEFVKRASGNRYFRFKYESPGDRKLSRGSKQVLRDSYKYDPEIFALYKTNSDASGATNDNIAERFQDSEWVKRRKRWMMILGAATVVWLALIFFYLGPKYMRKDAPEGDQPLPVAAAAGSIPAAVAGEPRIAGVYPTPNGQMALVEDRGQFHEVEVGPMFDVHYNGKELRWPEGF
jgi:zona occludens toxin